MEFIDSIDKEVVILIARKSDILQANIQNSIIKVSNTLVAASVCFYLLKIHSLCQYH